MEHVTKREVLALEKKIGKRSVAMRRWVNRRQKLSAGGTKKQNAIRALENTYVKIAPSSLGGVGVKAIRDIPKGTDPFPFSQDKFPMAFLSYEEISHLHPNIQKMIQDFHLVTGKVYDFSKPMTFNPQDKFPVSINGLNNMNVSWFLNHNSVDPNVDINENASSQGDWVTFITNRDIKQGEELRYNYNA